MKSYMSMLKCQSSMTIQILLNIQNRKAVKNEQKYSAT
jgi:hypothetical protein